MNSKFKLLLIKFNNAELLKIYNRILAQEKNFGLYLEGNKPIEEQLKKYHQIELQNPKSKSYFLYLEDSLIANIGYRGGYLNKGVELYIRTLGKQSGGLLTEIFSYFIDFTYEDASIDKIYFRFNATNTPIKKIVDEYCAIDIISQKNINGQLWFYYVLTREKHNIKQEMERLKPEPAIKKEAINNEWQDFIKKTKANHIYKLSSL